MKPRYFLLFLTLLISNCSFGQKLTLSDLTNLCSKQNWEQVNQTLQSKGWSYYDSKKGDTYEYSTIAWSFAKSVYDDQAQGWFHLFTYEEFPSKLVYNIFNKESYNLIKNSLVTNGFKLINNEIGDNELITTYSNSGYTLSITTSKIKDSDFSDNSVTSYSISLIKKSGIYDSDNGKKTEVLDDGTTVEYTLKDGKLNGAFKSFHENNNVKRTGFFINGIENGLFKEFDENNHLTAEYSKKDGEYNGPLKTFYPNNQLKKKGTYLKGVENGNFVEYAIDGSIQVEYSMLNGENNGLFKFYENQKLSYSLTYVNGILNGPKTEYYYSQEDGHLILKQYGDFVNDNKNGIWKFYIIENNKERLLSQITYLDGLKHGKFQDVQGDSLVFGNYKNEKLNGPYKVYLDFARMLTGGIIRTDTSNLTLICEGNYIDGLKSGYWKNYDITGTLINEGPYSTDLKTGTWRYYYTNYSDGKNGRLPYSGKLYLSENYSNGKLNGNSTRYSYIYKEKYLCSKSENNSKPVDSCTRLNFTKILESSNYLNDKLNGAYEIRDSLNLVLNKGNYANDIKSGEWFERFYDTDIDNQPYFIYYKGTYLDGKKTGRWIKYYTEGDIAETFTYKDGKLNGECVEFNSFNKPRKVKQFLSGVLQTFIVYDSLGNNPIRKFEIYDIKPNGYKCKRIDFFEEGSVSQEYWLIEDGVINDQLFDIVFYLKAGKSSDGSNGYRDGDFKHLNLKSEPITTGKYLKDNKIGLWSYYFYDQNVKIQSNYVDGVKQDEKYLTLNNQPFSGEFTYNDEQQNIKEIRKIKNGLRNGKTQYIDNKTNNSIKKENYKEGILD